MPNFWTGEFTQNIRHFNRTQQPALSLLPQGQNQQHTIRSTHPSTTETTTSATRHLQQGICILEGTVCKS